jgi:hypothetical protein
MVEILVSSGQRAALSSDQSMSKTDRATSSKPGTPPKREWAPRMWEGCDFFAWARLLIRNRFAVDPSYAYIALIVSYVSVGHTCLRWLQEFLLGNQLRRVQVEHAPIFILGHWRTGTTLLHEYLILDRRHAYPNTYQCLEPNHFLLTEEATKRWLGFLTPTHRPMDNMAAGFDRPQEDEFALCMIGQPSPYLFLAFPRHGPVFPEYLDLRGLSRRALASWKRDFFRFIQRLTFKDPRRLILKSPPHTCRIPVLLELFPDARFVHLVRDPFVVFPSTVHLWKSLSNKHCLHAPNFDWIEEYVFETYLRMFACVEEDKKLIPAGRFHELRYEELVANPVREMRRLYDRLDLGGFDDYEPRLLRYLETLKGYETNRWELTPDLRVKIAYRWGEIIRRYGYDDTAERVSEASV